MTDLLLDVPAHNILEFREILTKAGIEFKINKGENHKFGNPVVFEISASTEKADFARKMLIEMDTYITTVTVAHRKLQAALERIDALGLEVRSFKVAFRILGKPTLHKIEVQGHETALGLLHSKISTERLTEASKVKVDRGASELVATPSRGASGKMTTGFMDDTIDHDIFNAKI